MKKIILILIFSFADLSAQSLVQDSIKTNLPIDSTLVNSLSEKIDTIKSKSFDVDAIVYSSAADSLHFNLNSKKMFIFGNGNLKYKETNLKGGKIDVDFETNLLEAEGTFETEDSLGTKKLAQTPVLTEGNESYEGTKLKYNFKTQRGFISAAKNSKEGARYEGSAVKKVDKNTFFIKDGIYTTCEGDTPHTFFSAEEMKVIQKDKIIAKWIFMHIGGVPLPLPIPFAVFPNETGRRSGIITPSYGTTANRGQFFKNFGYFFAISDYMDLALTGDYYTRGGYGLRGRYRYIKKYNYSGNVNAAYSNIILGEDNDLESEKTRATDWNLSLNHNQNFTPTMNLSGSIQLGSPTYLQNNSVSYSDLLVKDINSQFTFSKRWDESGNSLNISYSRSQNVSTGDIREVLPNLTFTKSQTYPFKRKGSSRRDQAWYEYIGYSYSGQFRNTRNKIENNLKIRGGIQHSININASPKIGHFNISPRFSYKEKWYNKKTERSYIALNNIAQNRSLFLHKYNNIVAEDSLVERDVSEINMLRTFNFSLSASTKLYGMMQPRILGVEALRHTITPNISYNYTPDFSNENWDYYETVKRADGTFERYDPYSGEVFSGVGRGETQGLNFSLGNVFEMKTMQDLTDTTSKSEKINLLNLNLSSGYNFAGDSLKMADLRLSYRTQIGNLLNFSGSSAYTFYDFNENAKKINKYLASEGKGLFRLTNLNFSISTSISGDKLKGEERTGEEKKDESNYELKGRKDFINLYDEEDTDFSIPWNLSLTYNYNMSKPTPDKHEVNSNIGLSLGFNLAKNWKFTVRGNYDIQDDMISAPNVTIYRDLECWEMNFSWKPIGRYRGFRFEIRMKAPELQDVKITKTEGFNVGR